MKIMVVNSEYGARYFDVSTLEKEDAAAKKILKERLDEGWYVPTHDSPLVIKLISEEGVIDAALLKFIKAKNKTAKHELQVYKDSLSDFNDVNECLKSPMRLFRKGTQTVSFSLLSNLSCAYENRVTIEELEM